MAPAIEPGDWLLIDPTTVRWPRRGSVVVLREPDSGSIAIKRVAAGPGDRVAFAQGYLGLADDEAWLLSDASRDDAAARGTATRSTRGCTAPSRSAARRPGVVPLWPSSADRADRAARMINSF